MQVCPPYPLEPLLTTPKAQMNSPQPRKRPIVTPVYRTSLLIGGILGLAWFMLVYGSSILTDNSGLTTRPRPEGESVGGHMKALEMT